MIFDSLTDKHPSPLSDTNIPDTDSPPAGDINPDSFYYMQSRPRVNRPVTQYNQGDNLPETNLQAARQIMGIPADTDQPRTPLNFDPIRNDKDQYLYEPPSSPNPDIPNFVAPTDRLQLRQNKYPSVEWAAFSDLIHSLPKSELPAVQRSPETQRYLGEKLTRKETFADLLVFLRHPATQLLMNAMGEKYAHLLEPANNPDPDEARAVEQFTRGDVLPILLDFLSQARTQELLAKQIDGASALLSTLKQTLTPPENPAAMKEFSAPESKPKTGPKLQLRGLIRSQVLGVQHATDIEEAAEPYPTNIQEAIKESSQQFQDEFVQQVEKANSSR